MSYSEIKLPHHPNIERAVLGTVLVTESSELFERLAAKLLPTDFFLPSPRYIFESLLKMHARCDELNYLLLIEELKRLRKLKTVGGAAFIASLTDDVSHRSDLSSEIALLKEASAKRDLIKLGAELIKEAETDQLSTTQITRKTEHQLNKLRERLEQADESDVLSFIGGLYPSLDELLEAEIPPADEIMLGVRRGQPAMLAAVTNKGKTTMLANISLHLSAGSSWWPLIPDEIAKPRKVVFLDCESTPSEFRDDLRVMLKRVSQLAKSNFIPIVEPMIDGEPLNLSKKAHFDRICAALRILKPDLVIIDTITAAFTLFNENDNAEVARAIARPLKQMAKNISCAVIYTHHIGKQNESDGKIDSKEESYLPRGASAFASFTRTIYTLKDDKTKGAGYIILRLAKAKGAQMEPTLYHLNF